MTEKLSPEVLSKIHWNKNYKQNKDGEWIYIGTEKQDRIEVLK